MEAFLFLFFALIRFCFLPSPWPPLPYDPADRSPITFHTSASQNPSDPLPLMTWYTTTALDGGLRALPFKNIGRKETSQKDPCCTNQHVECRSILQYIGQIRQKKLKKNKKREKNRNNRGPWPFFFYTDQPHLSLIFCFFFLRKSKKKSIVSQLCLKRKGYIELAIYAYICRYKYMAAGSAQVKRLRPVCQS